MNKKSRHDQRQAIRHRDVRIVVTNARQSANDKGDEALAALGGAPVTDGGRVIRVAPVGREVIIRHQGDAAMTAIEGLGSRVIGETETHQGVGTMLSIVSKANISNSKNEECRGRSSRLETTRGVRIRRAEDNQKAVTRGQDSNAMGPNKGCKRRGGQPTNGATRQTIGPTIIGSRRGVKASERTGTPGLHKKGVKKDEALAQLIKLCSSSHGSRRGGHRCDNPRGEIKVEADRYAEAEDPMGMRGACRR